MYAKQMRIVSKKQVDTLLFTADSLQAGINPLYAFKADVAKRMVQGVPSKLPPYNHSDPSTMDVGIKVHGAKDFMKQMMGATDKQHFKNVEQYVGVVDRAKLDSCLPCFSVIYLYTSPIDNSTILVGKLVSRLNGRRYMYAMLNLLSAAQNQENAKGSQAPRQYLGIAKNRAITPKGDIEMICDFAVSLAGLKLCEERQMGFLLDLTAMSNFDYDLARLTSIKPSEASIKSIKTFAKAHNDKDLEILKRKG